MIQHPSDPHLESQTLSGGRSERGVPPSGVHHPLPATCMIVLCFTLAREVGEPAGRKPGSVLAAVKPAATPSSTGWPKAKPSLSDHSQPSKKPPPKRSLQDQWQAEDTKRQKLQVCCLLLYKSAWTPLRR